MADCKSGVSGAGRGANQAMLLCETSESLKSYGVGGHRHYPEIKQALEILAGEEVNFTFVPHLVPMIRGMQATIYVDLLDENVDIRPYFIDTYSKEPFVKISRRRRLSRNAERQIIELLPDIDAENPK